jgi:hypothetical protein
VRQVVARQEQVATAASWLCRVSAKEITMRLFVIAGVLAAFAGSTAFAQTSGYSHHAFCLIKGGSDKECAYDTMAQCLQAKTGNTDTCQPNSTPQNH